MSTRALIGKREENGSVRYIYCHFDGYLEGVGATLLESYQDPEKVDQLMNLGDLSCLGRDIGEKHDFDDNTHKGWCYAYGRDRGETGTEAQIASSVTKFMEAGECCDFCYLWQGGQHGGQWFWATFDTPMKPLVLKDFEDGI